VLTFARGQTLLETLIVVATVLVAIAVATTALHVMATNTRPHVPQLSALDAAHNAATELLAAAAYDATALDRLAPAQWIVTESFASSASPAPVILTLTVQRSGDARRVNLHYKGSDAEGDLPLTVRSIAPPAGSIIEPAASPSP